MHCQSTRAGFLSMSNDATGPKGPLPSIYKEDSVDMNQSQPLIPPETPTPPPGAILKGSHAPGPVVLPDRHQVALRHIHTLESHNAKLYEDNCRLVNAVNMLNERLAFLGAPQNTQVLCLTDLQEKLRASEANRMMIHRKYQDLLQCTSAGSAQRHINEELQATRAAYASLDKDCRLLRDKYFRLKAAVDANRVVQNQSQGAGKGSLLSPKTLAPSAVTASRVVWGQLRPHDRSWNNHASPVSVASPGSFQPIPDQKASHRRSSESIGVQPLLRSGPTPIATTWIAPLPSPPPSAPLPTGQISLTGFPVYAPVPAGSLPLPHHPQTLQDPRISSGLPSVTQSRHPVQQEAPEQLDGGLCRSGETTDATKNQPVPCREQIQPALLESSPRTLKRPISEFQTSTGPEVDLKKPRIEGEVDYLMEISADTCPTKEVLLPSASTDPRNDRNLTVADSDVRSNQDCVDLIFEKDADVENGIFCGLCFDRHEAKMIPDPPDVLIQPDLDFLVRHCMDTHPAVWEDLRRRTSS